VIDWGLVLNAITTIAVVVGIGFGIVELRQALRTREDFAAVDIVRAIQTQEIRKALYKVMTLPEDADPRLIYDDPEMLDAAISADSACESWGITVFEGVVPLRKFDEMAGGQIRGSWRRLHRWVEADRARLGTNSVGEWWQWLYEALEADPAPGKAAGAFASFRGQTHR